MESNAKKQVSKQANIHASKAKQSKQTKPNQTKANQAHEAN